MTTAVSVALVLPAAGTAEQARPSSRQATPNDRPVLDETPVAPGGSYDAFTIYPGIYETDRLYVKNPDATHWRGSLKPAYIKEVTCAETAKLFYLKGWWLGHLNRDGSCGPTAEPLEWATGNLLNFHLNSE